MTLRCAIIGCGSSAPGKGGAHSIGYAHGWAIGRVSGLKLVAAADRVEQNVADFAVEFAGCTSYTDYRAMLTQEKPDLVTVSAYPPYREEMVLAAVAAGAKGVVIEKPMAMGLGAARRMMTEAAKTGCRLFVHHQRRYGKPFEWWRQAVMDKEIGELEGIDIAQPFDTFINFGPHLVDAALFALGTERKAVLVIGATDLTDVGDYQGTKVETQMLSSLHFDDGTRMTIEVGKKTCGKLPVLRANGTRGFAELRLDPMSGEGCVFRKMTGSEGVVSPATNEHFHHSEDGTLYVHRAYEDIQRAMTTGSATRIDASEALRGLEIIMGIYESARLQRMLEFPIMQEVFPMECKD
ncbi:MAG: Gfo/Idh/MocA family oxidoreductase [bacterium]